MSSIPCTAGRRLRTDRHCDGVAAETVRWCLGDGHRCVIDHYEAAGHWVGGSLASGEIYPLKPTATTRNFRTIVEILGSGENSVVVGDRETLDAVPLKPATASLHWEFMFALSMRQTTEMAEQGRLLNRVSELVDQGELRSTQTETFSPISVENLKKAHTLAESGNAIGKLTLSGF